MILANYTAPKACHRCLEAVCVCNLIIGTCHFCQQPVMECDKGVSECSNEYKGCVVPIFKCSECVGKADA